MSNSNARNHCFKGAGSLANSSSLKVALVDSSIYVDREKLRMLKYKQYLCLLVSQIVGVDLALLISLNSGQQVRPCPYF
jgi:hypothetical protein